MRGTKLVQWGRTGVSAHSVPIVVKVSGYRFSDNFVTGCVGKTHSLKPGDNIFWDMGYFKATDIGVRNAGWFTLSDRNMFSIMSSDADVSQSMTGTRLPAGKRWGSDGLRMMALRQLGGTRATEKETER